MLGQRQLDDVAVDFWILVEEFDHVEHFLFRSADGQAIHRRGHAHRVAGFLLRGHVSLARTIVAHDDRRQMRSGNAFVNHSCDFRRNFLLDLFGNEFAINDFIVHI